MQDINKPVGTRCLVSGVVLSLLVGATPATVLGTSGEHSCMGFERSAISPPGSSDEEPNGSPQLNAEIKALVAELGVAPGAVFGFVARLRLPSHDACDEALE
jgi:hypothetical protein